MLPQWIIEKKRDGGVISDEEIRWFIKGYADGSIPDYQMAAMAMAIFIRGMTFDEVTALTDAMMRTGTIIDMSPIASPTADKHSTGGIGDKVSLILAPLVACCGIAVPMIAGRGLGITGGTIDKLESIPGYRTNLSIDEFLGVIKKCGCSIIGQSSELAPADRKLYALRDVTGTVPSIPLISASIMSKKLAENTDSLVLDIKWGKGAFMRTLDEATELAETMMEIGVRMNKKMAAVITDMNQPLGRTAGNALEVIETIEALKGNGPEDLMRVTMELSANMLVLSSITDSMPEAVDLLHKQISSGAALARFREMVLLHGGSVNAIDNPETLPTAPVISVYSSPSDGYIASVNAEMVGRACIVLGAGRTRLDEDVDNAVGISELVKTGDRIRAGDTLCMIHANSKTKEQEARSFLNSAFTVTSNTVEPPVLIVETMRRN